jgi:hypothetical protein
MRLRHVVCCCIGLLLSAYPAPGQVRLSRADSVWLASKGFFQRRATESSIFAVTRDDILRRGPRTLSELLRNVRGAEVTTPAGPGVRGPVLWLRQESAGGESDRCRVELWLNGEMARGRQERAPPPSLDAIVHPYDIDGLELYRQAQSPVAGGTGCGDLLIWSRFFRKDVDAAFVGGVRGLVVDGQTGRGVAGVLITLLPRPIDVRTDASGSFTFTALLPGEYAVSAVAEGYPRWVGEVVVRAYATVELELVLERGLSPVSAAAR